MSAALIGVGVGPGDPELITLKAARLIASADVISYLANVAGESQAKQIATEVLAEAEAKAEIVLTMPMSNDRSMANAVYDQAARDIQSAVAAGKTVVFLCEGDPLFFGSFAYLLERLQASIPCQVVPGIASPHAAASALQLPLTMLQESFAVVSGRHEQAYLERILALHDSVVIMKAGRSRQRILDALAAAGRSHEARYLEYIGRDGEQIFTDISGLEGESGPYFSLFVVVRSERDSGV